MALEACFGAPYGQGERARKALPVVEGDLRAQPRGKEHPAMAVYATDADRTDERADRWVTPDYQIVETSLEVTAYFTSEG
ncbi:pyrroloquinoline quinone precursor peptide PqqA [Actinomadura spongiicola]|uniref:Coenzyme PQQ synthesis protein A n=1 Tax=Actinomadura spongiicola TaxID=2303421 RepID=A0A372G8X3_9ACTN|nr:pyrroloquinoline quinone precursor peptide PqqA [Actinomadura spongiicola]